MSDPKISACGFMPPHVLERVAAQGSVRLRRCAQQTLEADHWFRQRGAPAPQRDAARAVVGRPDRRIHSAENEQTLPGRLVRDEGQPTSGDPAVDEAYEWLGATYRFYWEVFERDSIDDKGMPLIGTVHYARDYDNAFWNGSQMVFGDGDGELFRRFTAALEVIAHELTHGVIERDVGLIYADQAGALNESLADVFGVLVKQYHTGQSPQTADWLIGAALLTDQVQGQALRSMKAPGTAYDDPVLGSDPQPGHMRNFVDTQADNGGVHINSGIPNHAFYLAAVALETPAWESVGPVWYAAMRDAALSREADFAAFAALTLDHAERLHGPESRERRAVGEAWREVGVVS
ncbi:M4 family metallopeptidase [Chromohalobacter beijerinckii]|uniref:Neutral metalloproteinase n=1 Tax=Chromohalobacter beijerinckii TaxID=86179 RepID=A0ABV8XD82_9GAMM|nr:M4 family metallopeptidase [Chromohalobacter beijerinckii]MCK0765284.1 M4 family metallopeptidase [Chromohalobacter beijerinckii]